ncbi:MAG: hypothetical protein HOL01_24290 [Planctomycetaceae bacterium]|nr:hypothetical protein [Planctomycetaceae bacterium]
MMKVSSLFLIAATVASVCPTAKAQSQYRSDRSTFAARRHMDVLADRLWKDANTVCWEMYRHYSHNREFRETYREMYRVMKDAQHIHDLVHEGAHYGRHDVDHIASDLHEIDKLFHHIEDDIRGWSSSYRGHSAHYGSGHHDYGHAVHGDGYGDALTRKMRYVEQTLHHLMADYGVKSQLVEQEPHSAPPPPAGLPPAVNGVVPLLRTPIN